MNTWVRRLTAILQIGGGFMGLAGTYLIHPWNANLSLGAWLSLVFMSLLCLFGILAGLALSEGSRAGVAASAIYQSSQILIFSSTIVTYTFVSGFQLAVIVWSNGMISLSPRVGGEYTVCFMRPTDPWGAGVNIVALALFIYLLLHLLAPTKPANSAKQPDEPESGK